VDFLGKPNDLGIFLHLFTFLLDDIKFADQVLVRIMSILVFQNEFGVLILKVNDFFLFLLAFLEELVNFEDIRTGFSLNLCNPHQIVCLFIFPVVKREDQFSDLVDDHQGVV